MCVYVSTSYMGAHMHCPSFFILKGFPSPPPLILYSSSAPTYSFFSCPLFLCVFLFVLFSFCSSSFFHFYHSCCLFSFLPLSSLVVVCIGVVGSWVHFSSVFCFVVLCFVLLASTSTTACRMWSGMSHLGSHPERRLIHEMTTTFKTSCHRRTQ